MKNILPSFSAMRRQICEYLPISSRQVFSSALNLSFVGRKNGSMRNTFSSPFVSNDCESMLSRFFSYSSGSTWLSPLRKQSFVPMSRLKTSGSISSASSRQRRSSPRVVSPEMPRFTNRSPASGVFRAEHTADNKCVAVPYLMVEIVAAFGLFVSVAVRYRIALKKYLHFSPPQSISAKTVSVISPRQVPLLRSTSRASNAGSSSCGILIFTVTASSNAVSSTMPPCSGISEASRP